MSIMHWLEVMDIFLRCFSITPTKQLVIVIVSSIIITCIKMNTVITKTFSVPPTGSVWNRRVVSDTVVCLSLCYSPPLISAGRAAKCHGNITSVFLVHRCSSSFFPCTNDNASWFGFIVSLHHISNGCKQGKFTAFCRVQFSVWRQTHRGALVIQRICGWMLCLVTEAACQHASPHWMVLNRVLFSTHNQMAVRLSSAGV